LLMTNFSVVAYQGTKKRNSASKGGFNDLRVTVN
jgi:hypothetical protein